MMTLDQSIIDQLMKLAAGPEGCRPGDAEGQYNRVREHAEHLVSEGRLFKVKIGHKHVRYFANKKQADALQPKPNTSYTKPAYNKLDPNEPAIITKDTKFTVCPSPATFHVKQFARW